MREIPESYVKINQAGIVLFVILSFVSHQPWILFALWLIQVIGLTTGFNLFVGTAKTWVKKSKGTQALELQRFNNSLAVGFLTCSLLAFIVGWNTLGYIFATMLLIAAFVALSGYCIGCTVYFQYKQFKAKQRRV
ncbi:ABC-type multidrug transport system permease subunit [Paenibacillus shirakamiensis]|uniref:ABC-type multidrug transport system permease subunit n=1 Tax=Paenibacillus shirakamiensis TaxID=1265935 RepID=A0ABS4JC22_9BACL|nr:DUF4395 domain-containing protein [Paenibacillus shirakamiensis]MBP1999269.1 ABC-type multidrug transport system permease subunit [Paenibacillus shirakamiensis]